MFFLSDKISKVSSEYESKVDEQKQNSTKHHYHYKKYVAPMSPESDT